MDSGIQETYENDSGIQDKDYFTDEELKVRFFLFQTKENHPSKFQFNRFSRLGGVNSQTNKQVYIVVISYILATGEFAPIGVRTQYSTEFCNFIVCKRMLCQQNMKIKKYILLLSIVKVVFSSIP